MNEITLIDSLIFIDPEYTTIDCWTGKRKISESKRIILSKEKSSSDIFKSTKFGDVERVRSLLEEG